MAYDSMGRDTQTTDPLSHSTSWTYDYSGLQVTTTDPLSRVASTAFDSYHRGLAVQNTDAVGTLVQRDKLSNYDNFGRVTAARSFDGYWSTTTYDPMGRISQETDALGGVTLTEYDLDGEVTATRDAVGNWTKHAFNARGWETQTTDPAGNVWTNAFDKHGDLTAATDPLSHTTTHAFDALYRETALTDPLSHTTTRGYDPVGDVTAVTDANSHTTTYGFDALYRETTETDPLSHTVTTAYDAANNITAETDALGHTTTTAYDNGNRETTITDPLSHTVTTSYDAANNITTVTDALNKTVTSAYDQLNHLTQTTDPLGHASPQVVSVADQTVGTVDPLGDTTVQAFDPDGRNFRIIDPRGAVVQMIFDAASRTVGEIDPVGNITRYDLDRLGNVTKTTDPLGNVATAAYDSADRETGITDRDGRTRTLAYDNANRLTSDTWKNSSGTTVNTRTYSLDPVGNITQASDNAGTITMSYDAGNKLTAQTDVWGLSLTLGYDAANRLTQVQDSKSGVLNSTYDNADRLTSRQFGGTGMTQARIDPSYDARNEMTGLSRYTDTAGTTLVGTSSFGFDDAGRETAITHKNGSAATLSYYNYGYDNADRVTSQAWNSGSTNGSATYTYDRASELLTDSAATYSYDLNGNRTMTGYSTGTGNRLSTDGTWTYSYDNEGNLTQKTAGSTTWTYGYDNLNHMTSAKEVISGVTQVQVTYTYDVFNNRVLEQKYVNGPGTTTTRHAYVGSNVWADLDTSNNVLVRFIYGDHVDQPFARIVTSGTQAGLSFYLTDNLGSVRDVMNSSQSVVDHIDYDGYGNITLETATIYGDRIKFTAREWDADTGLQYNRARYYRPTVGGWTSQDPLALSPDTNPYRYVHNTPTLYLDPTGRLSVIFGGATQGPDRQFIMGRLFLDHITGRRFHFRTWGWPNNIWANIRKALQEVLAALKKNPNEPIYIFGYSRGGIAALTLAALLNAKGIKVQFLALVDPVATGGAQMLGTNGGTVFGNVVHLYQGISTSDEDDWLSQWAYTNIGFVKRPDPDSIKSWWLKPYANLNHAAMGTDESVEDDLLEWAAKAGVPLRKPPLLKKP
jgi:RHS repeat-associated protein